MPGSSTDTLGDLASLLRPLEALSHRLDALDSLDAAPSLAAQIAAQARAWPVNDLGGELQVRTLSALNDRLVTRVIALVAARHRLPPGRWCWLALGSEGRHEQTLVTDQDNGLVFEAADDAEAVLLREHYLPFADEVNRQLAACGFALCAGGIMAGRPACCLSLDEWLACFGDWVRRPEPTALLNASIFFDLRPICGDAALAGELRRRLLALTRGATVFLRLMAANALQAEVPLNFLGDLAVDGGKGPEMLDLKKFGSRIFVDAARIFALAAGDPAVSTTRRLDKAGRQAGLSQAEISAAQSGFSHLLSLRLSLQRDPQVQWHEFDRALLRESFKQARRLQQRLRLNYGL